MNKEKKFVSAVIYVHNNEKEIEYFLKNLNEVLKEKFETFEMICVNDYSTDKSVDIIKEFSKKTENASISIINMSFYQGIELSMNSGIDLAIGDFIYEFDKMYIDYEKNIIIDVYNKLLEGYDIVIAESNKKMRISSSIFYKIFNKHSNNQYKLSTNTFKIISRRVVNRIDSINRNILYRKAIYANCGLKQEIIKYESTKLKQGKEEKQQKEYRKKSAIDSLILFTDVSYKYSIIMAMTMVIFTIGVGTYTLYFFINRNPIQGWTTIMLFLSFTFFGMFSILTILIKYLSLIINLLFKKDVYLIESIEKL